MRKYELTDVFLQDKSCICTLLIIIILVDRTVGTQQVEIQVCLFFNELKFVFILNLSRIIR